MARRRNSVSLKPELRRARTSDAPSVRRLLRGCNLPEDGIEDQFAESFLVAENDGELIGVAAIEEYGSTGLLRSVAVVEACRSRAVGEHLVAECLDQARRRGLTEVYLLTLDAQEYFESFGFAVIDRDRVPAEVAASREFDSICPATATAMVLQLSGGPSAEKACREKGRHTWD